VPVANVASFQCKRRFDGQLFREVVAKREIKISSLEKLEFIDKFCYLGDLIGAVGGYGYDCRPPLPLPRNCLFYSL